MSNDLNCRRLGCFFANLYNVYYVICGYDCVIVNVDECNASQPLLALGSHSQLVAGMCRLIETEYWWLARLTLVIRQMAIHGENREYSAKQIQDLSPIWRIQIFYIRKMIT